MQNKPKKNKQKSRSSVPRMRRSAGASRNPTLGTGSSGGLILGMAAPIATGVVQRRFFGMRFGAAPPHDEFPEGGLRLSGVLPSNDGTFVEGKSVYGLFNSGAIGAAAINPTGAFTTNTAELFSASGPLAIFAEFFRRFRFRKLGLQVTSEVMPGVTTAAAGAGLILQVAHEPDIFTADSLAQSASYTQEAAVVSGEMTRFAAWANDIYCPVIAEKSATRSDELFFIEQENKGASTAASMRQQNQGAVTALGSALQVSTALTVSKVLVEFVVDLYGFTNVAAGSSSLRVQPRTRGEVKRDSPADEKSSELVELSIAPLKIQRELVRTSEPDFEEVPTPKSVKAAPNGLPPRSQSLKGR